AREQIADDRWCDLARPSSDGGHRRRGWGARDQLARQTIVRPGGTDEARGGGMSVRLEGGARTDQDRTRQRGDSGLAGRIGIRAKRNASALGFVLHAGPTMARIRIGVRYTVAAIWNAPLPHPSRPTRRTPSPGRGRRARRAIAARSRIPPAPTARRRAPRARRFSAGRDSGASDRRGDPCPPRLCHACGSWLSAPSRRALRHFPYRSVATFSLQDVLRERCDIFLKSPIKDFVATLVLADVKPAARAAPPAMHADQE